MFQKHNFSKNPIKKIYFVNNTEFFKNPKLVKNTIFLIQNFTKNTIKKIIKI